VLYKVNYSETVARPEYRPSQGSLGCASAEPHRSPDRWPNTKWQTRFLHLLLSLDYYRPHSNRHRARFQPKMSAISVPWISVDTLHG